MAVVEIREVTDEAGARRSLDIWNAVYWTMPASLADQADYLDYCSETFDVLAYLDGEAVGSGFAGLEPDAASPAIATAQVAVLPRSRRCGAGSALYLRLSGWAAARGRTELEACVVDGDPDGLASAEKRGFVEVTREALVALDLTATAEPPVVPPEGVTIVSWGAQPELGPGMYEVMREAAPDIPGNEEAMPS
jgi:GNAT superfamily N-acetyltransferase